MWGALIFALAPVAYASVEIPVRFANQDWLVNLTVGSDPDNSSQFEVIFDTGQTELILNSASCEFCKVGGWDETGFTANISASPALSINQGYGANATVGNVAFASMGSSVAGEQLWVADAIYNTGNASEPPPSNNPYELDDGILGAAELASSFCDAVSRNNTCVPSSLFLALVRSAAAAHDATHDATNDAAGDAAAFSVYFPPFEPTGVSTGAAGTLTLGPRDGAFEASSGPPAVQVPRADEVDAVRALLDAGTGTFADGKWCFLADDVLVNGASTGACALGADNNTLGKCLVFTDTGSPRTSVPPTLLTAEQQDAWTDWVADNSHGLPFPQTYCDEMSGAPLNISISVGGLLLSLTPPDTAVYISTNSAGRDLCIAQLAVADFASGFDDPTNPAYALPAPIIFAGNNWLRNFYVTHTPQTDDAAASMTLGCAVESRTTVGCAAV